MKTEEQSLVYVEKNIYISGVPVAYNLVRIFVTTRKSFYS